MERQDLKEILADVKEILSESHAENICKSENVKRVLNILEKEGNSSSLLNLLSKGVREKFRILLLDELGILSEAEIMLAGLKGDMLNIIHDVDDGKISKSTKRLLGRIHMDCSYNHKLLVRNTGEMTGLALSLISAIS